MKTKLLILALLFNGLCFSQTITTFESVPLTNFTIVTPSTTIDQTPTGANATWTFNNLTTLNTNIDTYAAPTATQLSTYPGTTKVLTVTAGGIIPSVNELLLKQDETGTSVTGISQGDIVLNYNGANAFIGLFPMAFGNNNSTAVSGTFSYQGTSGTFTGNITASVEAHGVLNIGEYNENVTRLRIDQDLSFSVPPLFSNIGTLTQTIYYYYNNTTANIDFRYNNTNIISNFLGINQASELLEFNSTDNTLSNNHVDLASHIDIYPNPVTDFINIKIPNNNTIVGLKIMDNNGRDIFTTNQNTHSINIGGLQSGLYFLSITIDSGMQINKKIVKK